MAGASRAMIRNYADDLRLFPTAAKRVSLVALIALYLVIPYLINDEWGSVLALAGVVAIGAIGYEFNVFVYLFIALVAGGVVGFVIGLPALRLRGNYLVIVTLGLVFVALYVWQKWTT